MTSPLRRVALLLLLAPPLAAQSHRIQVDASWGSVNGARRGAVGLWLPVVASEGRWHLALGARASANSGIAAEYTNRGTVSSNLPAHLPIDPTVTGVNAAVSGDIDLNAQVSIGGNLDLAGYASGATKVAAARSAVPQTGSLFLWAANDRGALGSEFYGMLRFGDHWRVRVGLSHYVTNYLVTGASTAGSAPANRYQRFETVPFIALGWIH